MSRWAALTDDELDAIDAALAAVELVRPLEPVDAWMGIEIADEQHRRDPDEWYIRDQAFSFYGSYLCPQLHAGGWAVPAPIKELTDRELGVIVGALEAADREGSIDVVGRALWARLAQVLDDRMTR